MKPITKAAGRSKKSRLTVIVIRNFGRVKSYQFSSGWITLLLVMFLMLAGVAGYMAYDNHNLRLERQRLITKLILPPETAADQRIGLAQPVTTIASPPSADSGSGAMVSGSAEPPTKKAAKSSSHAEEEAAPTTTTTQTESPVETAAQPVIKPAPAVAVTLAEAPSDDKKESDAPPDQPPDQASPTTGEPTVTTGPPPTEQAASGDVESPSVKVDDFTVIRLTQPQGLKISYKLRNELGNSRKISGYTMMLASDNANPDLISPFPRSAVLKDRKPANYKQGVYFSIFQFKTIRGRIYTENPVDKLTVLVFGKDGELLVKKAYDVPPANN